MTSHPPIPRRVVTADYVSIAEAGKLLSVSVSSVRRLVNSGELPAVRIGHAIRIPINALQSLPTVDSEDG